MRWLSSCFVLLALALAAGPVDRCAPAHPDSESPRPDGSGAPWPPGTCEPAVPEPVPLRPDRVYVRADGRAYAIAVDGTVAEGLDIDLLDVVHRRAFRFDGDQLLVRSALDGPEAVVATGVVPGQIGVRANGSVVAIDEDAWTLRQVWPEARDLVRLPARAGTPDAPRGAWLTGMDAENHVCIRTPERGWVSPHAPRYDPGPDASGGDVHCWNDVLEAPRWRAPVTEMPDVSQALACLGCVPRGIRSASGMEIWQGGTGSGARYSTMDGDLFAAPRPSVEWKVEPPTAGLRLRSTGGLSPDGSVGLAVWAPHAEARVGEPALLFETEWLAQQGLDDPSLRYASTHELAAPALPQDLQRRLHAVRLYQGSSLDVAADRGRSRLSESLRALGDARRESRYAAMRSLGTTLGTSGR